MNTSSILFRNPPRPGTTIAHTVTVCTFSFRTCQRCVVVQLCESRAHLSCSNAASVAAAGVAPAWSGV